MNPRHPAGRSLSERQKAASERWKREVDQIADILDAPTSIFRNGTTPRPLEQRYHRIWADDDGIWVAACKACGYTHHTPWSDTAVMPDDYLHKGQPTWVITWEDPYNTQIAHSRRIGGDTALYVVTLGAHDVVAQATEEMFAQLADITGGSDGAA